MSTVPNVRQSLIETLHTSFYIRVSTKTLHIHSAVFCCKFLQNFIHYFIIRVDRLTGDIRQIVPYAPFAQEKLDPFTLMAESYTSSTRVSLWNI